MRGRTPLGLMIATIVLSLLVVEQYPFSTFPMYSRFSPRTWYLYASDDTGRAVPTREAFGFSTPKLKKILRTRIAEGATEPDAGHHLLESLTSNRSMKYDELVLWRVEIHRVESKIVREARPIAAFSRRARR